jgi:hypothetical protein
MEVSPKTLNLKRTILTNIQKHVETWKEVKDQEDFTITRMSGLSNAVYRV